MTEEQSNLSSLPKDWAWTTIGDISEKIHYGYTAKSSDEPIGPKMLRITDIQNRAVNWETVPYCQIDEKKQPDYLIRDGDLVFARTGATVGKSFLVKGIVPEAVFASYLIRVIFHSQIRKEFVYYFFQSPSYWLQIYEGQIGIGQPNVNSTKLSKLHIPLPPFPEQGRIVSKLEELFTRLDAGVKSLQTVKFQLQLYRQAVLKHAFNGKLTEEWRKNHRVELASVLIERIRNERKKKDKGKYKELPTVDASDLPELPESWIWTRLGEVTEIILGQSPPSSTYNVKGIGLPFYQGKKEFSYLYPITQKWCTAPKKIAEKGDVLISVRAPVGPTNICPEKSCIGRGLAAIRGLGGVESFFILYLIRAFNNELSGKGTGTTFKAIRGKQLREFEIPLPPLHEQQQIVKKIEKWFSIAEEIKNVAKRSLIQSNYLRQSVLKTAFKGRLVVQDPKDEPAWKLLECIRKEKEKTNNHKKGSSRKKHSKNKQRRLNGYVK